MSVLESTARDRQDHIYSISISRNDFTEPIKIIFLEIKSQITISPQILKLEINTIVIV
jgi:hypothetical protein